MWYLFIILYKVVLTFTSADETLVCDHSKESDWGVLSCGTVHYVVHGWNPSVWPLNWKQLRNILVCELHLCMTIQMKAIVYIR